MRYRSLWAILLCLMVLLTGTAAGEEHPNLLKNPGFEQLDSDGLPSSWFFSAYRNQDGYSLFEVTADAYEGKTINVKGIVDYYTYSGYQVKVFSPDDITIV